MAMALPSNRSMQMAGVGALFAASALFILHIRKQTQICKSKSSSNKSNKDSSCSREPNTTNNTNDDELSFYSNLGISAANLPPHILRKISKEQRRKSKAEFLSMKSPMYDNVFMLDPQRNIMCTISSKKAKWYVKKKIAEWTTSPDGKSDSKKYIRLLFEPNGGKTTEDTSKTATELLYLRTPKQNICVSCGSPGHHMRHYVVPYSYRSLFPDEYKSHMSHDIVILCPDCHVLVDSETKRRMNRIEDELRDQLSKTDDGIDYWCLPVIEDTTLYHIRSCAIALVKWRENMPKERIESHERVVRDYLASVGSCNNSCDEDKASISHDNNPDEPEPLAKSQLQAVCSINYRVKNPEYITGSEVVVNKWLNSDDAKIEQFIREWRKHFVDTVHPRFMPAGWSVENPVVCGRDASH